LAAAFAVGFTTALAAGFTTGLAVTLRAVATGLAGRDGRAFAARVRRAAALLDFFTG
jgi:hypothetical protein